MFDRILNITYHSSKDCFLHIPSKFLKTGSCVHLCYGDNQNAYFSVSASATNLSNESISLNSVYARVLGINENEPVRVSEICNLPIVKRITIVPVNTGDYEILELLAENIQSTLLEQVRVVNEQQNFVIWVGSNINVAVHVENVESKAPGIIDFLTEVVIKPKSDVDEKSKLLTGKVFKTIDSSVFDSQVLKSMISYAQNGNNNLEKYSNIKQDLIFRMVPIKKLPFANEIKEHYSDFTVFILKENLPKSWRSSNSIISCSVKLLGLEVSEKIIYAKLCILDKSYLELVDSIYVSNTIFEHFGCKLGLRVTLSYIEQKPFVNEITISARKSYLLNIEEEFKSYLAQNCDNVIVLNSDILINVGDRLKCSLKFSPPEAKFCVVDDDLVRNYKFFINEEVVPQKENLASLPYDSTFIENMSNYSNILEKVLSIYSIQENPWENILITGNAGMGKTTLLKIVSEKLNLYPNFVFTKTIQGKAIKGKTIDSLFKVFSTAFSELVLYQPSVLFLDDLHLLCEAIKGDEVAPNAIYSNRVSEMLHAYLIMFSQLNKIGICATTESVSKLNKNMYSSRGSHLFKNLLPISDLSKADRTQFLKHFFDKYDLIDINFDNLAIKTEGFVVQDMTDFCNKTLFEAYKDGGDGDITININNFEKALKNTSVLSLQNVNLHSSGSKNFSDIGGLHEVKNILVENLMWPTQYPGIFAKAPLRLQSGLLLYGPPGTGKTLLAGAAAKHCGLRLISIKGPELLSKYIGASEQAVRDVFQKAQSARPCILFFDEFDSLAPRRGHDNTGVTDRVVNQLLTQLDGVESLSGVCVLAATSRPDLLDPALLRPGRLDRQILCPLPSKGCRLEILTALSKNLDLSDDVNLEAISSLTEGYSGADLQAILYTAQLSTIDHLLDSSKDISPIKKSQITQKHLEQALYKTRPSLPEQERLRYEKIYLHFQGGRSSNDFKAGSKATLA